MRLLPRFPGVLFPGACWLALWLLTQTRSATAKESDRCIYAVVKRGDTVFASTDRGLYQAALSERVWRKIPTPPDLPSGGYFARAAAPTAPLVYYTGPNEIRFLMPGVPETPAPALFVSKDLGQTWERTATGRYFREMFVQADGTLFADEEQAPTRPPFGEDPHGLARTTDTTGRTRYLIHHILVSHDLGRTWADISRGLSRQLIYSIAQDPEHPALVQVSGTDDFQASRAVVYRARDNRYQWQPVPGDQRDDEPADRESIFFAEGWGENTVSVTAMLKDFFKMPYVRYGNETSWSAVQIYTEKPAYTFRQHGPMPVKLTARFVSLHDTVKFYDNRDETVCWTLRGYPEKGKTFSTRCKASGLYGDRTGDAARKKRYAHGPGRMIMRLSGTHPYTRTVDLAKLYPFPGPGKYRVQAIKNPSPFFEDDASFTGEVIDVTVTP